MLLLGSFIQRHILVISLVLVLAWFIFLASVIGRSARHDSDVLDELNDQLKKSGR